MISGGSQIWDRFNTEPFLSAYLFVNADNASVSLHNADDGFSQILVFLLLWAVLKLVREGSWSLVDLSNLAKVVDKLRALHERSFEATLVPEMTAAGGDSSP